ncbi:MAG: hypothetical protein AVDCRST_MAG76-947, partial [uncultured Acidimicrobiales bacterium]
DERGRPHPSAHRSRAADGSPLRPPAAGRSPPGPPGRRPCPCGPRPAGGVRAGGHPVGPRAGPDGPQRGGVHGRADHGGHERRGRSPWTKRDTGPEGAGGNGGGM